MDTDIVSQGYHMLRSDWTQCPKCAFPALYSHLVTHLAVDPTCPMCEQPLDASAVTHVPESDVKLGDAAAAEP